MSKDKFLVCSRRRFKPPDFKSWVIPRKKGLKSLFDPLEHLTGHTYFSIPPMPLAKWSFYSVNVKCVNSIFDILYFDI